VDHLLVLGTVLHPHHDLIVGGLGLDAADDGGDAGLGAARLGRRVGDVGPHHHHRPPQQDRLRFHRQHVAISAQLKRPLMVMGADVFHPAPESRSSKPSIAGSVEPKAANYQVEVKVQDSAQNEEVTHDMENVTKNILMKFHDENKGQKPEKIMMYQDRVSEGQFLAVLVAELVAMHEACQELEEGYKPQITYIVVQKRHNTRFFPMDNNKYKNGNALASTVVARWWIIFKRQKIPH
jgi:hypothetical protein